MALGSTSSLALNFSSPLALVSLSFPRHWSLPWQPPPEKQTLKSSSWTVTWHISPLPSSSLLLSSHHQLPQESETKKLILRVPPFFTWEKEESSKTTFNYHGGSRRTGFTFEKGKVPLRRCRQFQKKELTTFLNLDCSILTSSSKLNSKISFTCLQCGSTTILQPQQALNRETDFTSQACHLVNLCLSNLACHIVTLPVKFVSRFCHHVSLNERQTSN